MPQPDYDGDLNNYNWLMQEIINHESPQAIALGHLLHRRFHPRSVLDVGCGPGIYLLPFKENGAVVLGIDGASGAGKNLDPEEFERIDLRTDWRPARTYDLVLCIEVGEHLKPEHHDNLVRIIANASAKHIFFSAARPGQGGEGHYGEISKEDWLKKFSKFGIYLSPDNDSLMREIQAGPEYEHCGWLRWNGMLLE